MLYNNGIGTERDPKQAFAWFEKAAEGGDPLASYKVGCYYAGQFQGVVPIDHDKALAAKLVAAKAGYFRAQTDVGTFYANVNEMVEAIQWWEAAAAQGELGAIGNLIQVYRTGLGVPKDSPGALRLMLIAQRLLPSDQLSAVQAEIDSLKRELDAAVVVEAERSASIWIPKATPLTVRANLGIQEARELAQ